MTVKPQSVAIRGAHGPVSANYPAEVECEAVGSRPPATVSWYLDDRPLHGGSGSTRHVTSDDVSVSVVRFTPAPNHNGRPLRCRAANPQMPEYAIEDSWILDVYCKSSDYCLTVDPSVYHPCSLRAIKLASTYVTQVMRVRICMRVVGVGM